MTFNDFETAFTLYMDRVKFSTNPALSRSDIAKVTLAAIVTKDSEFQNFLHFSAGYMCCKNPESDIPAMIDEVVEHLRNEAEVFRLINSFDEAGTPTATTTIH